MLKIKFNTNEFTIIFSEKIGKKKNAQKISFSLCSVQHPFFFSPSFLLFFFSASAPFSSSFSFCFQRPLFVSFLPAFLFFSVHVCPFFQPKNIFFQPKTILSSAQNLFQLSPHHCFSLFLFCFSLFSFCWFCFQRTFSFCSAPPFLLSFSAPHSLFFRHVALYFSAQNTFSAQNVF